MPEAAPRPALLRRLAVVGSFGLFALAVLQAQHGCGDESANAPATSPEARVDPVPADAAPPPSVNAEGTASAPPRLAPAATAKAQPLDRPNPGASTRPAANEEEIPLFLGASKSGRVMEPPRPRDREPAQRTQARDPHPQQNARPGT